MLPTLRIVRRLARLLLRPDQEIRLRRLEVRDAGHGYDVFGLHPHWVAMGAGLLRPLYERYWRVLSYGSENIPRQGAAILAANHSGMLPFDATMLWADVLRHTEPPRVARPMGDLFLPLMPFVGTFFSRTGVVAGSRGNTRRLLSSGGLLLVFPEGTAGIGKPFSERYQLQRWHVGHAELAIRHRAPVVPVAIIGPEEQWPQIARIESFHAFGAPWLPIPATPFPLPVRYHIHYGEPLLLHETYSESDVDDPAVVGAAARQVKDAVAALIATGLRKRKGVFS